MVIAHRARKAAFQGKYIPVFHINLELEFLLTNPSSTPTLKQLRLYDVSPLGSFGALSSQCVFFTCFAEPSVRQCRSVWWKLTTS